MDRVFYFLAGAAVIAALIASTFSLGIAAFALALAFMFFRAPRWIANDAPLFPDPSDSSEDGSDFEVLSESEDELTIRGSFQALTLNRKTKCVSNIKGVLCRFDQVRNISLADVYAQEGRTSGRYSVSLSLGGFSSITLGESNDQVGASIAAAKLSTCTGKPVSA